MAENSLGNSKFVIEFAHNKNLKHKLRICQVYKSEAPVDNKDLCVMQIPNMPWKFVVPTYKNHPNLFHRVQQSLQKEAAPSCPGVKYNSIWR